MRVSVIVTTYNRPGALKKVLDGLLAQTCLPEEIIIADDGSCAETRSMLTPYLACKNTAISHVWQEDKGFRAARIRNMAIFASTGNYLILLDGDCIPERHFISDHKALAEQGCFFQGKRVLVNKKEVGRFDHRTMKSLIKKVKLATVSGLSNRHHIIRIPFFPSHTTNKRSGVRSCNMGVFKKDIEAINGFNEAFVGWGREDTEFVIRLFRYGVTRKEHPFRAICYHLWHNENSRDQLEQNDSLLETTELSDSYYCKQGLDSLKNNGSGHCADQV
jgi:glycosyltransferase involved in cell wall biosynthesis